MAAHLCLCSCKCSRQNSSVQWTSLTQTLSFQRAGDRQIHGQSCGARAPPVGCFHITPTQPIAVIGRKKKHKKSTFPLSLVTSLRPPLGGLPLEKIQPLATRAEAWQAIPGLVSTSVQRSTAHVLRAEVMSLLVKGTLETVSPSQSESESSTAVTSSSPRRMVIEDPSSISDI